MITGVSGSGKSTLAFDTIYAEGQRRCIGQQETQSPRARRTRVTMLTAVTISTPHPTTIECESVLISDLKGMLERIAPQNIEYAHNLRWGDDNGHSYMWAALLGQSLSVPFSGDWMQLGTWQHIIFIDPDNRPRDRKLIVQIVGSDPRGILLIDQDGMGFVKSGHGERSPHLVLISPTYAGFYIRWVLICPAWNEENSVTIDARFCYWRSTCKTGVQPDRMQKRYVQALYLSAGFGDCRMGDLCSSWRLNSRESFLVVKNALIKKIQLKTIKPTFTIIRNYYTYISNKEKEKSSLDNLMRNIFVDIGISI